MVIGLTVMVVSILSSAVSPLVEWWIDNLPERRVAAAGVGLVLIGTLLQATQPVMAILHLPGR
jgi:predicted MFS family arabinose efflux permease